MSKNLKEYLWTIVEDNTTRRGKTFDYVIQVLIFISLISLPLETLPDLTERSTKILKFIEIFTLTIFSFEYLLRIYVAKNRLKYIFSFYGLIDLLAIVPFFFRTIYDLRALRTFRVFRIFKSLKLTEYIKAIKRFSIAIKIAKEEIILFLIATIILIILSAGGIYFFENKAQPEVFSSVLHSGWWAVVTLTTVGYGDVYPITAGGKIFTFFILLIGVGIVTIPAGLIASALSKAREIQDKNKN